MKEKTGYLHMHSFRNLDTHTYAHTYRRLHTNTHPHRCILTHTYAQVYRCKLMCFLVGKYCNAWFLPFFFCLSLLFVFCRCYIFIRLSFSISNSSTFIDCFVSFLSFFCRSCLPFFHCKTILT